MQVRYPAVATLMHGTMHPANPFSVPWALLPIPSLQKGNPLHANKKTINPEVVLQRLPALEELCIQFPPAPFQSFSSSIDKKHHTA